MKGSSGHPRPRNPPFNRFWTQLTCLITACSVGIGVTSCDPPRSASLQDSPTVSESGTDVTIGGVKIVVPRGAVAAGTKVNAEFDERVPKGTPTPDLKILSKGLKITLGDGLQPAKPLTVTIPVDKTLLATGQDTGTSVAMMIQSDGADAPDLVPATWDEKAGTITAQVPHLSWVWPTQLDLAPLMKGVRDTLVQTWNSESPRPACADQPLTIGTTTYQAFSPAAAWLCLSESNGSLVVTATPNSPVPFMITTSPASSTANLPDMSVANVVSVATAHLYANANQAVMMPGAQAEFTFAGAPADNAQLSFRQFPIMMLDAILAQLLDLALGIAGSIPSAVIAGAGCLQQVVATTAASVSLTAPTAAGNSLSAEVAADFIKSFLACAGTVLKLSPIGQIVIAILTAAPTFLAMSALGIINEVMQAAHQADAASFNATILTSATQAPKKPVPNNKPTVPGLPGVLEGKWCSRLDPTYCFSVADEKVKHPDLFVYYSGPADDAPGATDYAFCVGHTPGAGNTCSTALAIFIRYFPKGVGWNCSKNHQYYDQIPICDPDYSAAHDLSKPRIIHPPNHQQDRVYHDSEPMYLVGGGGLGS